MRYWIPGDADGSIEALTNRANTLRIQQQKLTLELDQVNQKLYLVTCDVLNLLKIEAPRITVQGWPNYPAPYSMKAS